MLETGDPGIGTYTHELATALTEAGVTVDVFTRHNAWILNLAGNYAVYPVLGRALVRQRSMLGSTAGRHVDPDPTPLLPRRIRDVPGLRRFRRAYLSVELAAWLRMRGYDFAWTQWPALDDGSTLFWRTAPALGLPVIHTAHNAFPHERFDGDRSRYGGVFSKSVRLIVHSRSVRRTLLREFPFLNPRVIASKHGLYTSYPRRPEVRPSARNRLAIPDGWKAVLTYGGVRPYKNIDSLIDALTADPDGRWLLVVAGRESGYPESAGDDPLVRTRRLVRERGLDDRVRLLPGPFTREETSELFEASDVVALPYTESYGSGVLLLAMSFGRHVIATATGGMDEYLSAYPAHTLLEASTGAAVLAGLRRAMPGLDAMPPTGYPRPASLEWSAIVGELLPLLTHR